MWGKGGPASSGLIGPARGIASDESQKTSANRLQWNPWNLF